MHKIIPEDYTYVLNKVREVKKPSLYVNDLTYAIEDEINNVTIQSIVLAY
jgi:hypothetical protein